MASAARGSIANEASQLEGVAARLQRGAPNIVDHRRELARIVLAMQASLERRCTTDRARFENGAARIATLDPMATLGRGFAIVQQAGGKHAVINSSRKVKSGHRLAVSVADGAFWAEVS